MWNRTLQLPQIDREPLYQCSQRQNAYPGGHSRLLGFTGRIIFKDSISGSSINIYTLSFFFLFLSWMTYSFHSSGFQNQGFWLTFGLMLKLFRAKTQSMATICTTCPWISPAQVSNPPISASAYWFLASASHFSKALFLHVRPHQWNISGGLWKRCQF